MKKLDLYWKENKEWWEYVNHIPTLKKEAPIEVKISYERYIEQLKHSKSI